MDIYTAIQPLKNYLLTTREFSELKSTKQAISQNPQLNSLLTEFKQKQESMYSKNFSQIELQKIMEELETEHRKLLSIPQVEKYFIATDNFNLLMSNVIKELAASLEYNLT